MERRIHILRGPRESVEAVMRKRIDTAPNAIEMRGVSGRHPSWGGLRAMLARRIEQGAGEQVKAALAAEPEVAILLFPEAESIRQVETREGAPGVSPWGARLDFHLSHTLVLSDPLIDGCVRLARRALEGAEVTLFLSGLRDLDFGTLFVIRDLLRLGEECPCKVVLADGTGEAEPSMDGRGILWSRSSRQLQRWLYTLTHVAGGCEVEVVSGRGTAENGTRKDPDLLWTRPGLIVPVGSAEARAWQLLQEQGRERFTEGESKILFHAVREAFRSFSFLPVLHLGMALVEGKGDLSPAELGEVHCRVGLAAHNRQFESQGNLVLAAWLADRFEAAAGLLEDPLLQVATLYRLAVAEGRRKGDMDASQKAVERCLEVLDRSALPTERRAHQRSWALNIRAYVWMRQGDLDKATADAEEGFALLEPVTEPLLSREDAVGSSWERELLVSRELLASNRALLAILVGEGSQVAAWRHRAGEVFNRFPGLDRFVAGDWIDVRMREGRVDLALDWARRGYEDAREVGDGPLAFRYLGHWADLEYRRGRVGEALRRWQDQQQLLTEYGASPDLLTVPIDPVLLHLRHGDREGARRWLAQQNGDLTVLDQECLRALVETQSGAPCAAEEAINRGVEAAVEDGDRGALLRVAVTAGEVCRQLERPQEEEEAWQRALSLLPPGEEGLPTAAPFCRLALHALIGAQEVTEARVDLCRLALAYLPSALFDAEAWWLLPRLDTLVARLEEDRLRSELHGTPQWALFQIAAAQRITDPGAS